ncbi:MAG: hypothetical protein KDA41_05830 [Planctomycetales bacterium]|nr:hypothetical protein [Planctomycetales bacterium]
MLVVLAYGPLLFAQMRFDQDPIHYGVGASDDPIAQLQRQLDAGETELTYDERFGYLPSLLEHLKIPQSSQTLVYSKTSLQLRYIKPSNPRAIYFNDDNYIGFVRGGEVLEVMSTDPSQGEMFYTLSQDKQARPRFVKDRGQCLACHASPNTQWVPGALVRSVYLDHEGQPHYGAGTFLTDDTSPYEERWGGWYVTGQHGAMRHMGNVVSQDKNAPEQLARDKGANVSDLADHFKTSAWPKPHSDIVALMVLSHQSQMHNSLTHANYEARMAAHYDMAMNKALERADDYVSDSTQRRIASAGENVLRHLLLSGEAQLPAPVKGTSGFAEEYQAGGKRDAKGRSLRDLDLQTRLYTYSCSPLIYSEQFDQLPPPMKQYVVVRLHAILTGEDTSDQFAHLDAARRQAIQEILTETKPQLWKELPPPEGPAE